MTDVHPKQPAALATKELDYELPERLIATAPAQPRDAARMLVYHRRDDRVEHRLIRDLPEYLHADDALVFNTTAVTPARLIGRRQDTGGKVEGLFLCTSDVHAQPLWNVMLKSNGTLRAGQRVELLDENGAPTGDVLELIERDEQTWLARETGSGDEVQHVLERVGRTPLPPYILRARGEHAVADALDRAWYQTVFASGDVQHRRSVAAPTAGLHFTPELLGEIDARGVTRLEVLLHVGAGTFKPVTAPTLAEHVMHTEQFEVPARTLRELKRIGDSSGRVIAVGTTTVRTLESLPESLTDETAVCRATDLLISPGYRFRHVDGLLTNFHLPRSTLLALVGAMTGLERLKALYAEAITREYRFYSYGDAMLVLP